MRMRISAGRSSNLNGLVLTIRSSSHRVGSGRSCTLNLLSSRRSSLKVASLYRVRRRIQDEEGRQETYAASSVITVFACTFSLTSVLCPVVYSARLRLNHPLTLAGGVRRTGGTAILVAFSMQHWHALQGIGCEHSITSLVRLCRLR